MKGCFSDEQRIAFSFAIQDIKNGHETLWTNRLKNEHPKLYNYAIQQNKK